MWLLKAGGCLIQFKYISLRIFGQLSSGCLIQVGCLIEVTTNTGLTVYMLNIFANVLQSATLNWSILVTCLTAGPLKFSKQEMDLSLSVI